MTPPLCNNRACPSARRCWRYMTKGTNTMARDTAGADRCGDFVPWSDPKGGAS